MKRLFLSVAAAFLLLPAFGAHAHAQAPRTWVSGVGNDANPCRRTAPCRTFAGAILKTAAGGEIKVLDSGEFGAVTITKPITLSSEGFDASVLESNTNAIIVNVPNATDVVVIRGLDIEGMGTGLSGITVLTGGTVQVEECTIHDFTESGINFAPAVADSQLHVVDTIVRNNGNFAGSTGEGILVAPTFTATASFDNVHLENNVAGLKAQGISNTTVNDSIATYNVFAGFSASASPAVLNIERSVAANNGTGVVCAAGSTVRIGNTVISDNGSPVTPGACSSF